MRKIKSFFIYLPLVFILAVCGRSTEFLYHQKNLPVEKVDIRKKVKETNGLSRHDVLWVIDNSGSMSSHQKNVIKNTDVFMQSFTSNKKLDWKMGLVSTARGDQPFVGFTPSTQLNSKSTNPVGIFKNAVSRLGLNKGCPELVFEPVMDALNQYPDFVQRLLHSFG
jgi:hypothetical protein